MNQPYDPYKNNNFKILTFVYKPKNRVHTLQKSLLCKIVLKNILFLFLQKREKAAGLAYDFCAKNAGTHF